MTDIVITFQGDKYKFIETSKDKIARVLATLSPLNKPGNVRFLWGDFIEELSPESLKLLKKKYPELFI
jgi:hypothetical protein